MREDSRRQEKHRAARSQETWGQTTASHLSLGLNFFFLSVKERVGFLPSLLQLSVVLSK